MSPSSAPTPTATPTSSTPSIPSQTPTPVDLTASYARSQPAPFAATGQAGSISGHVGYPADVTPPQAIYAISADGRFYYRVETAGGQTTYTLKGMQPGRYFVYSDLRLPNDPPSAERGNRFEGGYTICASRPGCTDHSAVAVVVRAGATTAGIDAGDWLPGSLDAYPLVPGNPDYPTPPKPDTFATAEAAAAYYAALFAAGQRVSTPAACPVNRSCFTIDGPEHLGQRAAYFTGTIGSNDDTQRCAFYVTGSGVAWQPYDGRCDRSAVPFPSVGNSGHADLGKSDTGCIKAYSSPSLTARVVLCLKPGTAVTIDSGPTWNPADAAQGDFGAGFWWHASGKGWISHRNLYAR